MVWAHYNRCILGFMRRHPERCVLMKLDQVVADPGGFIGAINARFGTQVKVPPEGMVESQMLHRQNGESAWRGLIGRSCPEAMEVLSELDGLSSLGAGSGGAFRGATAPAACATPAPVSLASRMMTTPVGPSAVDDGALFKEWFEGHARARREAKRKARLRRWLGIFGGGGEAKR